MKTTEHTRLDEAREGKVEWKKWGPYLSERQWGTVREDYSENGDAWSFFTHDQARSRAYRWGEDGLAGISDDKQRLCFALALWNGKEPDPQGAALRTDQQRGEPRRGCEGVLFYIDSTPTHSYMKYLYKYPQAAFPYDNLVKTNRGRSRKEFKSTSCSTPESSTMTDTSTSSLSTRKAGPRTSSSRSRWPMGIGSRRTAPPADAVVPQRLVNVDRRFNPGRAEAHAQTGRGAGRRECGDGSASALGEFVLACEGDVPLLFTENETNHERLFPGQTNESAFVKDGIDDCVVDGQAGDRQPRQTGDEGRGTYKVTVGAGQSEVIPRAPLERCGEPEEPTLRKVVRRRLRRRRREADEFYKSVTPAIRH